MSITHQACVLGELQRHLARAQAQAESAHHVDDGCLHADSVTFVQQKVLASGHAFGSCTGCLQACPHTFTNWKASVAPGHCLCPAPKICHACSGREALSLSQRSGTKSAASGPAASTSSEKQQQTAGAAGCSSAPHILGSCSIGQVMAKTSVLGGMRLPARCTHSSHELQPHGVHTPRAHLAG